MPVPGLVHRYPDRVLLLITDRCAAYCRYCTRSRVVSGAGEQELHTDFDEAIERGFGVIHVGDSVWRVAGADCPKGGKVRVTAIENGALLKVEKV